MKCELLKRPVKDRDECAVNVEALRRMVESQEDLDDELRLLREEHRQLGLMEAQGQHWLPDGEGIFSLMLDLADDIEKLQHQVDPPRKALIYLSPKSRAIQRQCPTCGWMPLDSMIDSCPSHKLPLIVRPRIGTKV